MSAGAGNVFDEPIVGRGSATMSGAQPGAGVEASDQKAAMRWSETELDDDEVALWQLAGFSPAEADAWQTVLDKAFGSDKDDEGWGPRFASAWIVAGFKVETVNDWIDALALDPVDEQPMRARAWREAGLSATQAGEWRGRVDVDLARKFVEAGWEPLEVDLLRTLLVRGDEAASLLEPQDELRLSMYQVVETGLEPKHLLDYVKAGLPQSEYGAYERLRDAGIDVTPLLRQLGEGVCRPYSSRFRADRLLWQMGGRRGWYHAEELVPDVSDSHRFVNTPEGPMPADWTGPALCSTARERGESVQYLDSHGWNEWTGHQPPEEYAYEPDFDWESDQERIVTAAVGACLEPGETCYVEWPPTAFLTTEGCAFEAEGEACGELHDEFEATCWDCVPPSEAPDFEPAIFAWTIMITVVSEDGDDRHEETRSESIMTSAIHPLAVEYRPYPQAEFDSAF